VCIWRTTAIKNTFSNHSGYKDYITQIAKRSPTNWTVTLCSNGLPSLKLKSWVKRRIGLKSELTSWSHVLHQNPQNMATLKCRVEVRALQICLAVYITRCNLFTEKPALVISQALQFCCLSNVRHDSYGFMMLVLGNLCTQVGKSYTDSM